MLTAVMKQISKLTCSCAHCSQLIQYAPEAAGQIIECVSCKRKSQIPPAAKSPPSAPASQNTPPASAAETQPGSKQLTKARRHVLTWLAAAVLFGGVMVGVVFLTTTNSFPTTIRAAEAKPPSARLPQPKSKTAKSLNDLKIGSFTLQQTSAGNVRMVTGDIVNHSENLHRGIKVELELLDAQGPTRVGTLSAFITELRPHATWHVLESTSNVKARMVRVIGIKEEP